VKQIDRLHPPYAFLTDNDTAVESVAGSTPYESRRQLQRLKRRLVKIKSTDPVDLPPRTRRNGRPFDPQAEPLYLC
jgi:hypothetical protein